MSYRKMPALLPSETVDTAVTESAKPQPEHQLPVSNHASRFERLAADAQELPRWPELLDILLGAASPSFWGGRKVLSPLWADEAMHRTRCTIHLARQLEHRMVQRGNRAASSASCLDKARALADALAELRIVDDLEVLPCSGLLGATSIRLLRLFDLSDGDFDARIVLEDLAMAAYKRRALILAANALVMQTIMNVMNCTCEPVISIKLSAQDGGQWRLAIATQSAGRVDRSARDSDDIVDGLADLLEAQNVRRLRRMSEFLTEIDFPGPKRTASSSEGAGTALLYTASVHC